MRRRNGNVVVIIAVIVVVLVVAGILGYVAWSKFGPRAKTQTAQDTEKTDETKKPDNKVVLASYCLNYEMLCFDYPANWNLKDNTKAVNDANEFASGDHVTVTSPDSKLTLYIETGISGIGGNCESETASTTVLDGIPVPAVSGYSVDFDGELPGLYIAKIITHDSEGFTYSPQLYITNQSEYVTKGTVTGKSGACFSNFVNGRHATFSADAPESYGAVSIGTGFNFKGDVSTSAYGTLDEAEAQFDTELYQQAISILASLHYQ